MADLLTELARQWQYDKWGQPEQDGQDVEYSEEEPACEAPD